MAKAVSKPLTKVQLNHYKQILENKAAEIRKNMLAPSMANLLIRREDSADVSDLCTQSHEQWIFLNRKNLEVSLLRQVEEALARIVEQTYGICEECESAISVRRLDAIPWANFCVTCQERQQYKKA